MTATFRVNLFGAPELTADDGGPIRLRTRKQLAVLVYLVLEGRDRPVSREKLLDLMWPGVPVDLARHSLSQAFTAIRTRLGKHAIASSEDDVRLRVEVRTDLDDLMSGQGARAAPPEPLLGLDVLGGPAFGHWVDGARARIQQAARDALLDQVTRLRAGGEISRVHEQAAVLYEIDPMCEAAVHALAERALLRGDGVAAIRLLRSHLDRTLTELNCVPQPDLTRLLRRLEAGAYPSVSRRVESRAAPPRPAREAPFVGRVGEMAELEGYWARAREGKLETVLVTGPAGMGKSALLGRFTTGVAARANPVFLVVCQEIGSGIPFAAVTDLMLALLRDPGLGGTDPQWLAEASRVCPALRGSYPGIPEPPAAPGESVRVRIAEATFRMLEAVADGGPLLLVFDDVQHMDPASRDVVHVVARRIANAPTMLLAAARAEDGSDPMREMFLLYEPERIAWRSRICISPLARDETQQLVDLLSADEAPGVIREKIAGLAQGNPYFTEMLVADWQRHTSASLAAAEALGDGTGASWRPPETLRLAFAREYEGLSVDARDLAHVLAVARRAMAASELVSLLGIHETDLDHAALELCDRALVRVDGGKLTFKNELHRAFVYYAMTEDSRRYHHGRIARWLDRSTGDRTFGACLEGGQHYLLAGMIEDGISSVRSGSGAAIAQGAPQEAERAILSALPFVGTNDAQLFGLLLAEAKAAQGKYNEALKALSSYDLRLGEPSRDAAAAARLRTYILHRGRLADDQTLIEVAEEAVRRSQETMDDAVVLSAFQIRAEVAADLAEFETLTRIASDTQRFSRADLPGELRARALLTQGFCLLVSREFESAESTLKACAELLTNSRCRTERRLALNGMAMCATALWNADKAEALFRRAIDIAKSQADVVSEINTLNNLSSLYFDMGRFVDAGKCFEQAFLASVSRSNVRQAAQLNAGVAHLALVLGDWDASQWAADRALEAAQSSRLWRHQVDAVLTRADLHLAKGDDEEAWPLVRDALSLCSGREGLLTDQGLLGRLRLRLAHATDGKVALCRELDRIRSVFGRLRVCDQMELDLTMESLQDAEPTDPLFPTLRTAGQQRLFGPLARVLATGGYRSSVNRRGLNASAQLREMFPGQTGTSIETPLAFLRRKATRD